MNTRVTTQYLLSLLGFHLSQIKLQFSSFQDVTISATALSGAAGDGSQQTTSQELFIEGSFDLGHTLTELVFLFGLL